MSPPSAPSGRAVSESGETPGTASSDAWLRSLRALVAGYVRSLGADPVGVAAIDPESGRIMAANAAVLARLDVSREQLPERHFLDFVHRDDRPAFLAQLERVTWGRVGSPIERVRLRRADGTERRYLVFAAALPREGMPRSPLVVVDDTGSQPRAALSPAGPVQVVLTMDERGYVRMADRSVATWGFLPSELVDRSVFLVVHPGDLGALLAETTGLLESGADRVLVPIETRHADHSWHASVAALRVMIGRDGAWGYGVALSEPGGAMLVSENDPRLAALTRREREVLVRLLDGRRVRTIAGELFLSESTVRGHLSAAFRKLGVASQVELIERFRAG